MTKRQKIRKSGILVSFLLFPITIYYLSPVLIIMGAKQGVIAGSFIIFSLLFIVGLVLGRAFCGWVCPGAGIQEICSSIRDKPVRKGDWIKYLIWVPWMGIIVIFAIRAGGLSKVDPFFQIPKGISITQPTDYVVFYFFLLLIILPAFVVGKRSFCHHICWMAPFMVIARKIRDLLKWPSLRLVAEEEKCVQCKICDKKCPMSLGVEEMVQQGSMENTECILCGSCVDNCPEGVIEYRFRGFG
ncbi:MAG: 4Fe-4S binding protein [Deltaproteobacteria bacterium]|nr:MAG: 4Fe-4S binding protein [Deltaproteobacteria bacterium]